MRTCLPFLSFLVLAACSDKGGNPHTGDTQNQDTDSGNQDTDTGEEIPVWTEHRIESSNTLTGLYPSATSVVVVAQGGKAWIYLDDAWSSMSLDTDGEDVNDVWGSGNGADVSLVAVGNVGTVAEYASGTWTLTDIGTANLLAIDGPASGNLLSVGWGGVFSNVSGAWSYQDVATGRRFNDVWWDGTDGMAVGEDGDFAVYANENWADDALDSRRTLYGVDGRASDDIWAVGEKGAIYHWDGSQWTSVESPTSVSLWDVWESSETEVYVVGNNGEAWVYNGTDWTKLPTGVENNLYGVGSYGDGTVWAIGNRGMVISYDGASASTSAR